MSSSDPPAKVRVDLRAADDVTELTVFDGQFQQVGRGFGRIQTKLAPGLYTVRLRAGGTTRDRLLSIGPSDTEVVATYPALSFVSAAPLEGSVKSRESQREAATQFASLSAPLGNGSALFVFARNWDPTGPPLQGEAEPDPAQGLSIWDATGQQQIADLSAAGSGRMSGPSWVACSVLVEPGGYRLRQTLADGRGYELALVASPGWQTQVFLPPLRRDKSDQSPKFSGATILLSKDGGFDPSSPGSRLVELARQALCRKVTAVTPEVIRQILSAKLNNPMLGLIGAHLVLASSSDQDHQALFTDPLVLLRNLRGLLGDAHPDVEALALKLTPGPSAFRFTYPPMLRRSWALVIDASTSQPELVPNDSPAARIASRVCGPEPWLVWRAGEDDTEEVLESVLEEHLRIAAPDAGPLEAVPSRSLEARLGERGLKSLAHSLGLPGGQVKALVQRAGTRTVRAQPLPMEVPEKPEPTPLAPRAEIVQTRAAYERDRGARFILETWAPVDLRQAERAARDRLGRACEVEPLFPQADDRAWLGRFFLARLPGVRFGDLPDSPFDWAYNVRDGADLFRSVEPDLPAVPHLTTERAALESAAGSCFLPQADGDSLPRDWALQIVRAQAAWALALPEGGKARGEGSRVGHLDTGYANHAAWQPDALDLQGAWDFVDGNADATDPLNFGFLAEHGLEHPGHGTATGSVIVGRGQNGTVTGVAPAAKLVPIRCTRTVILTYSGSDVARAIEYAARTGCHVISMSLGGLPRRSLEAAVTSAVSRGAIVVAAAGNCVRQVTAPALYPQCLAVAATNAADRPWVGSCRGPAVDVAAPGEFVWCARREKDSPATDTVRPGQGTSFAVAHVAGAAALWLAHHGRGRLLDRYRNTPGGLQAIFQRLVRNSARRPGGWNSTLFGAGVLDTEALLKAPLPPGADSPLESLGRPAQTDYLSLMEAALGAPATRMLGPVLGLGSEPGRAELAVRLEPFGAELVQMIYERQSPSSSPLEALAAPAPGVAWSERVGLRGSAALKAAARR